MSPRLRFARSASFRVVGLLFVVAALAVLAGDPASWEHQPPWALGWLVVGVVVVLARTGVDVRDDGVRRWWGLLVPMIVRRHARDSFDTVALVQEVVDDDDGRFGSWTITLDGVVPIEVTEASSEAEAHTIGRALARELQLRLVVVSAADATVREIGDVHLGLRERLRRDGFELGDGPGWLGGVDAPTFLLPSAGLRIVKLPLIAIGLVAGLAVGLLLWRGGARSEPVAVGVLAGAAVLAATLAADALTRVDHVELRDGALRVRSRRHGRWTEVTVPVDELDVLDVRQVPDALRPDRLAADLHELVLRGRGGEVTLGAGRAFEELDGVRTALHAALAASEAEARPARRRGR